MDCSVVRFDATTTDGWVYHRIARRWPHYSLHPGLIVSKHVLANRMSIPQESIPVAVSRLSVGRAQAARPAGRGARLTTRLIS
jgi:hypothetical protein